MQSKVYYLWKVKQISQNENFCIASIIPGGSIQHIQVLLHECPLHIPMERELAIKSINVQWGVCLVLVWVRTTLRIAIKEVKHLRTEFWFTCKMCQGVSNNKLRLWMIMLSTRLTLNFTLTLNTIEVNLPADPGYSCWTVQMVSYMQGQTT